MASPSSSETDEQDRIRRRVFWAMPSGLYVVGSRAGERRNAMTLNWATQVSSHPVMLGIAVQTGAVTHQLLTEGEAFTLNILHREDRALVRKFVKPAPFDAEAMTLNGVPIREGVSGAPILTQALAFLDCRISQRVLSGDHTFFIGEVIDAGFHALTSESSDAGRPEVLRMEDTRMNYGG